MVKRTLCSLDTNLEGDGVFLFDLLAMAAVATLFMGDEESESVNGDEIPFFFSFDSSICLLLGFDLTDSNMELDSDATLA